jgi:hypothetical protein
MKALLVLALALLVAIVPPCTSLGLLRKFQSRNLLQMDNETQVLNKLFADTNAVWVLEYLSVRHLFQSLARFSKCCSSFPVQWSFHVWCRQAIHEPFHVHELLDSIAMSSIPSLINETDDWIAYEDGTGMDNENAGAVVGDNATKPYSLIRLDKSGSGRILAGAAMLTGAALVVVLGWRAAKHATPRRN